jgi:hypothetical protein
LPNGASAPFCDEIFVTIFGRPDDHKVWDFRLTTPTIRGLLWVSSALPGEHPEGVMKRTVAHHVAGVVPMSTGYKFAALAFSAGLLTACAQEPAADPDLAMFDVAPLPPIPPLAGGLCVPGVMAVINGVTYGDLQSAIMSSVSGDTIYVCPGTWFGGYSIPSFLDIVIAGATGNPNDVVMDGGGASFVFDATFDSRLTFSGLTVRNADKGIDQPSFAELRVLDCVFEGMLSGTTISTQSELAHFERVTFIGYSYLGHVNVRGTRLPNTLVVFRDVQFVGASSEGDLIDVTFGGSRDTAAQRRKRDRIIFDNVTFEDSFTTGPTNSLVDIGSFRDTDIGMRDLSIRRSGQSTPGFGINIRHNDDQTYNWIIVDSEFLDNDLGTLLYGGDRRRLWGSTAPRLLSTLRLIRTNFLRNEALSSALRWGYDWQVEVRDTDFGSGADANTPSAISGCWDQGYITFASWGGDSTRCPGTTIP